jgi:hypothetical protein
MPNTPALTLPLLISNGEAVNATVTNRIVNSSGGLLDTVTLLANHTEIVTGNSNIVVTSNQLRKIYCTNTSNIIVDLPTASTQLLTKDIEVIKIGKNTATVTIRRTGVDTLGAPWDSTVTPINTTIPLLIPGESVKWQGTGNIWYPISYTPGNLAFYDAWVGRSGLQNFSGAGFQKIQNNVENLDASASYDSVTNFRYSPKVNGLYQIVANVTTATNVGSDTIMSAYKNGAEVCRGSGRVNTPSSVDNNVIFYNEAVVGDNYEVFLFNSPNARNSNGGFPSCQAYYKLLQRT